MKRTSLERFSPYCKLALAEGAWARVGPYTGENAAIAGLGD
jgi:hypothetical protein